MNFSEHLKVNYEHASTLRLFKIISCATYICQGPFDILQGYTVGQTQDKSIVLPVAAG